jgi:hypothetical protein
VASIDDPWPELAALSSCAHISADAITLALENFTLKTDKDARWIAAACRRAFFSNVGGYADDHPGMRAVREELLSLENCLAEVRSRLAGRSDFAESTLRRFSVFDESTPHDADGVDAALLAESLADWRVGGSNYLRAWSPNWRAFDDATKGIADVERYIAGAIDTLCSRTDPPRWRDAERRKERIGLAVWLSAIFEVAYAKPATINNWSDGDGKIRIGAWPDFFNRVACLSLKLPKIPDLSGVLKAARKQYLNGAGVILPPTFLEELRP